MPQITKLHNRLKSKQQIRVKITKIQLKTIIQSKRQILISKSPKFKKATMEITLKEAISL
jgi:predicted translin family RNA/ssDNA-binding protein